MTLTRVLFRLYRVIFRLNGMFFWLTGVQAFTPISLNNRVYKICEGVQSIHGTLSENAKTKQKPFKIWKGKSFIEVLNANLYPVKNR